MKLTGLSPALTYTPLFSPRRHTRTCIHIMARARTTRRDSWPQVLSTHAHTSTSPDHHHPPPPPPTSTHIQRASHKLQAVSLSCQLQTRCESRMLTERRYVEVTHEPRHIWWILVNTSACLFLVSAVRAQPNSLGCERGGIITRCY